MKKYESNQTPHLYGDDNYFLPLSSTFDSCKDLENKKNHDLKSRKKASIYRLLCCVCFPCLPMWTRTLCCFLFLFIVLAIAIISLIIVSFKEPLVMFSGSTPLSKSGAYIERNSTESNYNLNMDLSYSVYNANYFPLFFERIKAVAYHPFSNKTLGAGEMHNLVLNAHAVTNFTFPFQSELDPMLSEDSKVLQRLFSNCGVESKDKQIAILFDIMPTIRVFDYPITLAFIGQKSTMSCTTNPLGNLNFNTSPKE